MPASGSIFSQEPGFRVMFTKKGLDYGKRGLCTLLPSVKKTFSILVFGPVLRDGLRQLSIPDIEGEKKVKLVGKVRYHLTE